MTKLGLHVSSGKRNGFGDYLRKCAEAGSPVPVIFSVGQGMWDELQRVSPTTVFIFRTQADIHHNEIGDGPGGIYFGDPVQSARDWMALMMPMWALNKAHYYAPLNEQDPPDLAGFTWLNTFTIECMKIAEVNGYKLALYAFSGGNPKDVDTPAQGEPFTRDQAWLELVPSLQIAKANGHILLLHEYGFDFVTLKASMPHLATRYRHAYRLLAQYNADPALVISEASAGVGYAGIAPRLWIDDAAWYDTELVKDRAVIGCCLYQLGGAENFYAILPQLAEYTANAPTPTPSSGSAPVISGPDRTADGTIVPDEVVTPVPIESYRVIATPSLRVRKQPALSGAPATPASLATNSVVDLLAGPTVDADHWHWRKVAQQADDHWVAEYNQVTGVRLLEKMSTPPAVSSVADRFDAPVGTSSERAQRSRGKWPGAWFDATGYAQLYQVAPNPAADHTGADLNLPGDGDAHAAAYAPANGVIVFAEALPVWGQVVIIKHTLADGSCLWSRLAHLEAITTVKGAVIKRGDQVGRVGNAGGRYAYHLHFDVAQIDLAAKPGDWPGLDKPRVLRDYVNPLTLLDSSDQGSAFRVGLHDIGGLEWMFANGKQGVGLDHVCVTDKPVALDYTKYAASGIDVIVRINYGYADGTGTLPPPDKLPRFEQAVIATLKAARGVKCFQYANEVNNRSEWPAGFTLTPDYYTHSYNRVWAAIPVAVKMGPAAIDPYYGPGSNNREWWTTILANIQGADVLFLHPKTQTNDPAEIESSAKFGDDPLKWQYLHFRTIETSLEVIPARFKTLPVYLAEVNPQRRDATHLGWKAGNVEWVKRCKEYVRQWNTRPAGLARQPITGIIFYRWSADEWALQGQADLLSEMFSTIRRIA